MKARITVNGVEYASVEAMPPDVREQYERALSMLADRNNNGVPDILEGPNANVTVNADGTRCVNVTSVSTQTFNVSDWKDLPPQAKRALDELGERSGAKRPGVSFDFNVGFHDRVPRSAEKSRWRGLQTLIVLAIVLATWGIVWMLSKR